MILDKKKRTVSVTALDIETVSAPEQEPVGLAQTTLTNNTFQWYGLGWSTCCLLTGEELFSHQAYSRKANFFGSLSLALQQIVNTTYRRSLY